MRLRSILRVPAGVSPGEAVLASPADAVLVSVADADVPLEIAREAARQAIGAIAGAGKVALALVNHPRTQLLRDDLAALAGPQLAGIFLNQSSNPQDVRDAAVILRELELKNGMEPGHTAVFPVIATARGILRAADIVEAAPRVAGLLLDAEAYARDVGGRAEEHGPRLAFARGSAVAAARAFDRLPLVTSSGLELRFLAQHGFAGALFDEDRYAMTANQVFTPGPGARRRAERLRDAYEAARSEGAWVGRAGSEVADAHSARKALQIFEATSD